MKNMISFKPWGMFDWILDKLPPTRWSVIGSVATGNRSLAVWSLLKDRKILDRYILFKIHDSYDPIWGDAGEERLLERHKEFSSKGGDDNQIIDCQLFDSYENIILATEKFLDIAGQNVIVDISTLPKRYFFPIVKTILRSKTIVNFAVTYTRAEQYSNEPLSVDPEPWRNLPLFGPPLPEPNRYETSLVIGLGYELLGLPSMLRDQPFRGLKKYSLFFPFPATPAGYKRNWEFNRQLENELGSAKIEHARVNAYDIPGIYDSIISHTNIARDYTIFAPFGPKPMSLAMCLYCAHHENISSAYYTQPRAYNPQYSCGIKMVETVKEIYFYCIRLKGQNLYT
jgi:hypothetical protein